MASMETIIRQLNNENNAKTFKFNADEAQKARDYQTAMSNTSHQREVMDLKAAGINPILSANGGAQAYSASSASASADNSAVGALAGIYQTKMSNENARKIANQQNEVQLANKKMDLRIAQINAAASNYAANKAYSASRYASDNSYNASRYASDNNYAASTYASDLANSASRYNTDVSSATSRANSKRQYKSTDAGLIDSVLPKTGNKAAKGVYLGVKTLGNVIGKFLSRH